MLKTRNYLLSCLILSISFLSISLITNENISLDDFNANSESINYQIQSSSTPNSKPLLINQFATTSNSFFPLSLPTNVHFTLTEGWKSKNVTIYYEGISINTDTVTNGEFPSNYDNWFYDTNNPTRFENNGWQSGGYVQIQMSAGSVLENDYAVHQQNVSNFQPFSENTLATFSIDYLYDTGLPSPPSNLTLYLAIEIDGVEVNKTIGLSDLTRNSWTTTKINYDPSVYNQILPGNVTMKLGLFAVNNVSLTGAQFMQFDNIKYEIWTMPNTPDLIKVLDIESNLNYTYNNLSYGQGYSFIDFERTKNVTTDIEFTVFENITDVIDFKVENITVTSFLTKTFNSSFNGKDGSYYTNNHQISWETEISINNPSSYLNTLIKINKPVDWEILSIYDSYMVDRTANCSGLKIGSADVLIPGEISNQGLWKVAATSTNYIISGNLDVWNGTSYKNESILWYDDTFEIKAILNDSIPLDGTFVKCLVNYPNGSVFLNETQLASQNVVYGNFSVDQNMSVGIYKVLLEWTNNDSYHMRDRVGFKQFNFSVWHNTNLSAINPYLEVISGESLLVKVNFTDVDSGTYIYFASVTYNSTFGSTGTAAYMGSGVYIIDVDTSSLSIGYYYFSFNASKEYYQNQEINDLIQIKIISEPLVLEVPQTIQNADANSYIAFQTNLTGLTTRTFYYTENISINWQRNYTIKDFENGTWEFNISTLNLPVSGIPELYIINIFANKTHYGSTTSSIFIRINPIPTVAFVNQTFIQVYQNHDFGLVVNYTIESSGHLIGGANFNIDWPSDYNYFSAFDSLHFSFNTTGLNAGYYQIFIELNHAGYETAIAVINVMIIPAETQLILLNPEPIEVIKGDSLNISCLYLSDGECIVNSSLNLIGEVNNTFIWNGSEFYSLINSQNLETRSYLLQILATSPNYQPQLRNLIMVVKPLKIEIQIPSMTYSMEQGRDNILHFNVYDESHGCPLEGFNVSYEYNGLMFLINPISNGSYQIDLDSLNLDILGSYHQITLIVANPYGEDEIVSIIVYSASSITILQILIITISTVTILGLGVVVGKNYIGVSKFQRRIRGIKKRLKKNDYGKVNEPSRNEIIRMLVEKYLNFSSNGKSGRKINFNGKKMV